VSERLARLRTAAARANEFLAERRSLAMALLFVVALAPRVVVALTWARSPVWDGQYYHYGAQRIAEGFGYGDVNGPWSHYPVGYSGFLALFYAVLGSSPLVATMAGALVGSATATAVYRLALYALDDVRALAAGLFVALHPGLIVYTALVMSEPLAGLGLVFAPLVALRLRSRPWVALGASGLVVGATTLVRPETVLAIPAVAWVAMSGAGEAWRRAAMRVASVGLVVACAAVVVAPWTARNCVALDGCAFVSTNAGWNFAIGASPHATGRFDDLRGGDGCGDTRAQVAEDACWRARGIAWLREDPLRWLRLVPKKLGYTFDYQAFAPGYLAEADPVRWPAERKTRWIRALTVLHVALLLGALFGSLRGLSRSRRWARWLVVLGASGLSVIVRGAWPLAVATGFSALLDGGDDARAAPARFAGWAILVLAGVHAVFIGEDRYAIVVMPLFCLLAAGCMRRPAAG
jgi:4-amino-4-deoxy-L-arabinose transferase-like glycosyltransferase